MAEHEQRPLITVAGSVTPSSISLANPKQSPILLTLTLTLSKVDTPLTLYTPDSFLASVQTCTDSAYSLIHAASGKRLEAGRVQAVRANRITINPETQLLTLYPNVPTPVTVQLAVDGYPRRDGSEELCLCATPLTQLRAGERYRIGMYWGPDYPNHVWWWAPGEQDRIVHGRVPWLGRVLGKRQFQADQLSGPGTRLTVKMVEQPEINVEP